MGIPGIARRKSNVGQTSGVELRGSYNSQHSNRTLNTTFESSQDELVLTEKRTISSRPTSGHHYMLATSTPSHSRSPSMTSNRDSVISNEEGITFDPKH